VRLAYVLTQSEHGQLNGPWKERGDCMYPVYVLLGLMFLTWGAAIYASCAGESVPKPFPPDV
jgi:hypothetical protein